MWWMERRSCTLTLTPRITSTATQARSSPSPRWVARWQRRLCPSCCQFCRVSWWFNGKSFPRSVSRLRNSSIRFPVPRLFLWWTDDETFFEPDNGVFYKLWNKKRSKESADALVAFRFFRASSCRFLQSHSPLCAPSFMEKVHLCCFK